LTEKLPLARAARYPVLLVTANGTSRIIFAWLTVLIIPHILSFVLNIFY